MARKAPVKEIRIAQPVAFGFTELLYGILIGTAIARIESFTITRETVLLLLALVFAFEDYVVFHVDVQSIPDSGRNFILLFVHDLLALGCWYAVVLATTHSTATFFVALAAYFAATSLWGWQFAVQGRRGVWDNGDIPLVAAATALAALASRLPLWLSLGTFCLVFVWWRLPTWRHIWRLPSSQAA